MKLSLLPLLLVLFTPLLGAQNTIFSDDFEDGVPPWTQGWSIDFNQFMLWHFQEANGFFEVTDMGSTFGGTNEQLILSKSLGSQAGTFQLDFSVNWNDNFWVPANYSHLIYTVSLESQGQSRIKFRIIDQDRNSGGQIEVSGGGQTQTIPGIQAVSDATVSLGRDASGQMNYSISGGVGSHSGSLGVDSSPYDKLAILVQHSSMGGPGRDMLAETYTDFVHLTDGGLSGPTLSVSNLIGGQTATLILTGGTAGSPVVFAYSRAGGGPTNTPFGDALLSPPINRLATVQADANGSASFQATVPPPASGLTVWLQALDFSASVFSNGIQETIG